MSREPGVEATFSSSLMRSRRCGHVHVHVGDTAESQLLSDLLCSSFLTVVRLGALSLSEELLKLA